MEAADRAKPVRKCVDGELGRKDDGEGDVETVKESAQVRHGPVAEGEGRGELRLNHCTHEVLPARSRFHEHGHTAERARAESRGHNLQLR